MIHDGHRERLRERFIASPESFADHELLELLLCYSIKRQNTNDTAHNLLNKFGSIKSILDADIPALTTTEGIGENSAMFIRVVSQVLRRYEKEKHFTKTPLDSPNTLIPFLKSLFVGTNNEMTYMLGFDSSQKLILTEKIAEGYSCGHAVSMREIVFLAISSNAAGVILAHNHPNGRATPSGEDLRANNRIRSMLSDVGIDLIENFVVTDAQCYPIINPDKAKLYNNM